MKRDIFIRRGGNDKPAFSVAIAMGRQEVKGDVGLEIEVEGNKFPKPDGAAGSHHAVAMPGLPGWSYVHDGSLRGKDNAEYILTRPILFKDVPEKVTALFRTLSDYGSKLDESNRTSVHVHLNCQRFHFNQLASLVALYITVEEVLTQYCGDHRVGNLFCLRTKDAPAIATRLREFIETDGASQLSDNLHYAGLNAQALAKFGSIEIRALRGATDPETVINWVAILQRVYELAAGMKDPRAIPAMFSQHGPLSFFEEVFGPLAGMIREGAGMSFEDISEAMFRGIRLAQDICYCRDWDAFKEMDIKADPFGRDAKKIAQRLMSGTEASDAPQPMPVSMAAYSEMLNIQTLSAAVPTAMPIAFPGWTEAPEYDEDDD